MKSDGKVRIRCGNKWIVAKPGMRVLVKFGPKKYFPDMTCARLGRILCTISDWPECNYARSHIQIAIEGAVVNERHTVWASAKEVEVADELLIAMVKSGAYQE